MVISTPSDIPKLLDLVHDLWFDIEQVERDFSDQMVTIRLCRTHKGLTLPGSRCILLRIKYVDRLNIIDTERVGCYDINKIVYDGIERRLTIACGIPITLNVYISALNMVTEECVNQSEGK